LSGALWRTASCRSQAGRAVAVTAGRIDTPVKASRGGRWKEGALGSGPPQGGAARRFPTEGSASAELAGSRRHLGFLEAFSFARGGGRGPWSGHPLARPLQGRMTVLRRHEMSGGSSSWPLRRCAHAGSRAFRPVWAVPTASSRVRPGHTARRTGVSIPDQWRARKTRSPARCNRSRVCSRVVFGKQKSAGGVWPTQVVPGCGWGQRTGPSPGAGNCSGRRDGGGTRRTRRRVRGCQGLQVELLVDGRRSGSWNAALFTEAAESDLGRPGSPQHREKLRRVGWRRSVRGPALVGPCRKENVRCQRRASWPKRVERRETRNPPANRGLVPPSEPVATRHAGARL